MHIHFYVHCEGHAFKNVVFAPGARNDTVVGVGDVGSPPDH